MKSVLTITVAALAVACHAVAARADTDACSFLTEAQVGAAVGFTVAKGTHVTPSFVKTCTWSGSNNSGVQFVTLNLQTAAFFDGAKRQGALMSAAGGAMKPASVGDDGFFSVQGTQVMLWVKKGGNAFKLAVYKQIPVDQKQGMELTLAKAVAAKL